MTTKHKYVFNLPKTVQVPVLSKRTKWTVYLTVLHKLLQWNLMRYFSKLILTLIKLYNLEVLHARILLSANNKFH